MPAARPARRLRGLQRRLRGMLWLLFALGVAALGAVNGLGRVDALIADRLLAWTPRPAPADVVIVAIDDASLTALGRWPWPRVVHAQLLDALTPMRPRAVGLDLLFSEPDDDDDRVLADAMRRNGRVVLPLRMAPLQGGEAIVSLPVPVLASAAAGLGHLHVGLEADGIARGVFLREGFGNVLWDHFAWSLARVAGVAPRLPAGRHEAADAEAEAARWWRREQHFPIPFSGPPGHLRRLSYVDVLEGRVDPAQIRDAIVLVGATAPGLSDAYLTPVSGRGALMPGVEIAAQALDALREGRWLRSTSPAEGAALAVAPLLLAMAALRFLRPRAALLLTLALLPAVLALAWWLRHAFALQWPPAAAMLGLLLLYPLWSWHRLETALNYLEREFKRNLRRLPPDERAGLAPAAGDLLDRRIAALSAAAQQLRSLERQREEAVRFLSHDLRAPLSATLALIEMRPRGADLAAIESHTRRALALAEGFIQLARAGSAHGYRMETLDLRDLLIEAIDGCWPQAQRRSVEIVGDGGDDECLITGDRTMLTRALLNLIDNALRHGSRAGDRVHCRLARSESGWRVEVADSGAPLSPETAAELFLPFRRGRGEAGGAGLGLAFVSAVARRHEGRAAWQAHAMGNVFFIELPPARH
ncbi:CHASE2 domain-containing protein [Caldimonas sp. KR1-144]|uniref:CHASE2 domain-containing protein n=1 Tax=Caldimonas sp. KR1-144 TaxID=3400911 RepID=UPI003BFB5A22